jgi:hypothetical protein
VHMARLRIWPYSLDRWGLAPLRLRGISPCAQLILYTRRSARKAHDQLPSATRHQPRLILRCSSLSYARPPQRWRCPFAVPSVSCGNSLNGSVVTLSWARALRSKGERLVLPVLLDSFVVSLIDDVEVLGR